MRGKVSGWQYVEELAERQGVADPRGLREQLQTEALTLPRRNYVHRSGPIRYQDYLYAILRIVQPRVVVETGVRLGVSTYFILHALQANGSGKLVSCDPVHPSQRHAEATLTKHLGVKLPFDRWTFLPERSISALDKIGGPWDVFVHDSDHGYDNMSFELNAAWSQLRGGGLLVCDDYRGHPKEHKAFEAFTDQHHLVFWPVSTAAVVERAKTNGVV
ncbi:MAG: class I SAM-dependent methyltransferase [Kiloniellales bacterium]|nr:class I SAM-dependent methyltransferase [Kiloniellales bacterium]